MNRSDLGRLLGIGERHVSRLSVQGLFPRVSRGRFDPFVCVPAYVAYQAQGKEASNTLYAERLKHVTAQRIAIEQRTAARDRKLIPLDEAVSILYTVVGLFTSQLDGMGGRTCNALAAETDPALTKDIVFHETRRIRAAAATQIEALAVSTGSRRDGTAAGSNDSA